MERVKGPQFLRFCIPIVEALKELGGSGQPGEVADTVLERLQISEEEQAQTLKNGGSLCGIKLHGHGFTWRKPT